MEEDESKKKSKFKTSLVMATSDVIQHKDWALMKEKEVDR